VTNRGRHPDDRHVVSAIEFAKTVYVVVSRRFDQFGFRRLIHGYSERLLIDPAAHCIESPSGENVRRNHAVRPTPPTLICGNIQRYPTIDWSRSQRSLGLQFNCHPSVGLVGDCGDCLAQFLISTTPPARRMIGRCAQTPETRPRG
jgi:hypothetical protein